MKTSHTLIIGCTIILGFSGCGPRNAVSNQAYQQQLNRIELGMSRSQFQQIFPQAARRGAKRYSKGVVEVFEVTTSGYHFMPSGNRNRNELTGMEYSKQWFYFLGNELVQYGTPHDWPSEPDLVIENRIR